ncbi:uncharacterized protein LOC130567166 [Triplophysa rosa]|uniref:uncharacterized protein LOC130567166 n=1 Tax=Triplophysa rosa TaxID=992332 RepID=UPI002545CFC1|nr:uncharacterized protein LOC130567166 [Triplophysa rosa]
MNTTELSFMTWNTNGLRSKIKDVITEIEKHKCHVAFIQETHIGRTDKDVFKRLDNWKSVFTEYRSQDSGVAILIRKDILSKSKIYTRKDAAGCYIAVKCTLKGQLYTLVSVYTHQIDSRPLKRLRMILENFAAGFLLIGGDFNIPLNPFLDRNSLTENERHFMLRPTVEKLMTSFHLVDVWRRLNPVCRQYTFSGPSSTKSRLDYLFVPEESVQYVKSCKISVESCRSDHQPVLFKIRCNTKNKSTNDLVVSKTRKKSDISKFVAEVSQQWLTDKQKKWGQKLNMTFDHSAFEKIQVLDVEKAIQSLAVNKNKDKRPDGISLLFYRSYSYALIPYLCVFYHNLLKQPVNVPKSFNTTINVYGTHFIYNVDYLILATIMARWLNDHLDFHSENTHEETGTKVLFAFKKGAKMIPWSLLQHCLRNEQTKEPPLHTAFNIDLLEKLLKNSSCGKYKLLCWGCPLTPVLMRLCLIHVAERFLESEGQEDSEVFICKENVIVRISTNVSRGTLEKAREELPTVHCEFVDELTSEQS